MHHMSYAPRREGEIGSMAFRWADLPIDDVPWSVDWASPDFAKAHRTWKGTFVMGETCLYHDQGLIAVNCSTWNSKPPGVS